MKLLPLLPLVLAGVLAGFEEPPIAIPPVPTFPEEGAVELLRHTRFPLGMQAGWVLQPMVDTTSTEFLPAVETPDYSEGDPWLEVAFLDSKAWLQMETFAVAESEEPHELAIQAAGWAKDEPWIIEVRAGEKVLASRELAVKELLPEERPWQWFTLPFTPAGKVPHHIRVRGRGELDIRRLQVGPVAARAAGPYPLRPEVAWRNAYCGDLPPVHEGGSTPMRVIVTGPPVGGEPRLQAVATLHDGRREAIVAQGLDHNESFQTGYVEDFQLLQDVPFGPVRIQAWVEAGGVLPGPPSACRVVRIQHDHWEEDPESSCRFGIVLPPLHRYLFLAKCLGFHHVLPADGPLKADAGEKVLDTFKRQKLLPVHENIWRKVRHARLSIAERCGFPGDAAAKELARIARSTPTAGDGQPLWVVADLPPVADEDERARADRLCRLYLSFLAHGADRIVLAPSRGNEPTVMGPMPTLFNLDDTPTLAGVAIAAMARMLDQEDLDFDGVGEVAKGIHAFRFRVNGELIAVISGASGHAPFVVPEDTYEAFDLLGNPVETGAAYDGTLLYLYLDWDSGFGKPK